LDWCAAALRRSVPESVLTMTPRALLRGRLHRNERGTASSPRSPGWRWPRVETASAGRQEPAAAGHDGGGEEAGNGGGPKKETPAEREVRLGSGNRVLQSGKCDKRTATKNV
jgi:hypothetical protein